MEKSELHLRNRHRARYDFPTLIATLPELGRFVAKNQYGDLSVDFSNPEAVKVLNRALLDHFYQIREWDIPPGYLCPPIPGRSDYLHYAADLLGTDGKIPRGNGIRVLDIGSGANAVYPLIGHREYGWTLVGTEIDPVALASANRILDRNPDLKDAIEFRLQPDPQRFFAGILKQDERFDLVMTNPPFHSSREEAESGSERKWRNLGKAQKNPSAPKLNFGGQNSELWCVGGERAFITGMIEESRSISGRVRWFTALVAKEDHLPALESALIRAKVKRKEILAMAQGQKKSRILAWSYGAD